MFDLEICGMFHCLELFEFILLRDDNIYRNLYKRNKKVAILFYHKIK